MLISLLSVLLFQTPEARGTAVIWGGGTTRELALVQLNQFEERRKKWDFLDLSPGYPSIVSSDTMPGLKPGFFVVLLGVCAAPTSPVVSTLDALEPAVYTRSVEWKQPEACPSFPKIEHPEDPRFTLTPLEKVDVGHGCFLSTFSVSHSSTSVDDAENRGWSVYVFLDTKKDHKEMVLSNEPPTVFSKIDALRTEGQQIRFEETYLEPSCANGSHYVVWSKKWMVSVSNGRLTSNSPKPTQKEKGTCNAH
jgi:hypothetical protein